ncbi:hypothetical protein GGI12_003833 [Dipsacomyces acuminosporus]|nr:hypothetical protein GGI12_003833 [Dipsacomyces acuminosporus]
MQGSRPSSPSNSLRTSRIPRLPSASDGAAPPRRLLHEQYYELMQRLRVEQETNNELMEELRSVASYTELLGSELEQARVDASEAKSRTELAESALEEQKAVNVALESKIAALSAIICTQADTRGTAMDGSLPSPLRSQGKNIDGLVLDATVVAATAARDTGADDGLASSEQPPPSDDWRADRARILAEIGAIHATCTLDKPESEMDEATKCDLRLVEQYLDRATTNDGNVGDAAFPAFQSPTGTRRGFNGNGNGSGSGSGSGTTNKMVPPPSPHLVTPVQRKIAEQEERAKRRRSTMMFAGLIRPSNGTAAPTSTSSLLGSRDLLANTPRRPSVADDGGSQTLPCGRCQQLLETMQALEIDNDYYREANGKLRDSIADVVSKHNALVRLFERERMRRRENRANALAEASRVAARDRAVLEAQQRAELEATMDSSSRAGGSPHKESLGTLDGELAQEFARALSIVSPTAARYKPPRSRLPAKTLSEDSAHMAPPSITSPLHS